MLSNKHNVSRSCAVCGSAERRLLFRQQFSQMSSGTILDGYDVVACANCGFTFADRIPEQAAFDEYYREMSKYESSASGISESEYESSRLNQSASFLIPFLQGPHSRILDVGCATGHLLAVIREKGYSFLLGLDPSPACAQIARERHGIEIVTGNIGDYAFPPGTFDFIIMEAVLEHVQALSPVLRKVHQMLASNGRIYISVPDASRFSQGQDAPFQEFSMEHINFLGPTSLSNLMGVHGFSLLAQKQDMVEGHQHTSSPALYAIFAKVEPSSFVICPDCATELGVVAYIKESQKIDAKIQEMIRDLADSGQSLIVWGTGTHTLRLLETSRLMNASIAAFVDSNPRYWGKALHGVPIISPSELKARREPILISSRVYQWEILRQAREELGLQNHLITLYEE